MKKVLILLFFLIALIGIVSAQGECRMFGDEEWCCDESGHEFCDNSNPNVCGTPEYCENREDNQEISCIPGEDWCCNNEGWVADYGSKRCCSPDYPFHYDADDSCWNTRTPTSENYYTQQSQCEYIWNPSTESLSVEEQCSGNNFMKCAEDKNGQWVDGWESEGFVVGKCGVECSSGQDKCEGETYYTCSSGNWDSQGRVDGQCGYEIPSCNTNADLNCDGEVNRNELGVYVTKWLTGEVQRSQLAEAIQAWSEGPTDKSVGPVDFEPVEL